MEEEIKDIIKNAVLERDSRHKKVICKNQAYYTETNALWLKKSLDAMLADEKHRDFCFSVKDFRMKRGTLYQKVFYSWRYLTDHLDPDTKYLLMRQQCRIIRDRDKVVIQWGKSSCVNLEEIIAAPVDEPKFRMVLSNAAPYWKKNLLEFIEKGEEQTHTEVNQNLTIADMEYIINIISNLNNFVITRLDDKGFRVVCSRVLAEQASLLSKSNAEVEGPK